jgi:hypothetical protein
MLDFTSEEMDLIFALVDTHLSCLDENDEDIVLSESIMNKIQESCVTES